MIQVEQFAVINVHGIWQNSIKTDTEAKIEQSKKILDLAGSASGRKIICGDFHLLPDTRSIRMLNDRYRDLIHEFEVVSTRSPLYTKAVRYSDYVFADKDLRIKSFVVSDMSISDHLPMVLEFE